MFLLIIHDLYHDVQLRRRVFVDETAEIEVKPHISRDFREDLRVALNYLVNTLARRRQILRLKLKIRHQREQMFLDFLVISADFLQKRVDLVAEVQLLLDQLQHAELVKGFVGTRRRRGAVRRVRPLFRGFPGRFQRKPRVFLLFLEEFLPFSREKLQLLAIDDVSEDTHEDFQEILVFETLFVEIMRLLREMFVLFAGSD